MNQGTVVPNTGNSVASYAALHATSGGPYTEGLSPDALLIYLSTRLGSLEDQINAYFVEQQRADELRSLLSDIKVAVNRLNPHVEDMNALREMPQDVVDDIEEALEGITKIDPDLANRVFGDLQKDGLIGADGDLYYTAAEIEPTTDYLDNAIGDLNSSSQMNMIHLQSLVRAHETAVSLGTNLVEAAGRTTQKIADRIGG